MPGRLTIIEQIVHYSDATQQPTEFSPPPCTLTLKSDEQPYGPRHIVVGEEFMKLERPWFSASASVGQLIIVNREGQGLQQNPTAEEREAIRGRVVELASNCGGYHLFAKIRPGQSIRLDPVSVNDFVLRCVKGQAKIVVMMYPE